MCAKLGKIIKTKFVLMIAGVIIAGIALLTILSPYPLVWLVRLLFMLNPYTMPADYAALKDNVEIIRNIDYHSRYPKGYLDIIRPKNTNGSEKLIFYTHGGGFIEGDKTDVEHYFVMLANEGFVTVNINYALAPEKSRYPIPVKQLEEAYVFIQDNAQLYNLNMHDVYFGGDSAGGQIAGQFIAMQTNYEYLDFVNSNSPVIFFDVIDRDSLHGILFFCALFNFEDMINPPPDAIKLPMRKIGEAYFKTSNVKDKDLYIASITDKINSNFPPSFVTDGNKDSLEWEAKDFVQRLTELGVPVDAVFYEKSEAELPHVYQFFMNKPEALKTYQKVLEFLKRPYTQETLDDDFENWCGLGTLLLDNAANTSNIQN